MSPETFYSQIQDRWNIFFQTVWTIKEIATLTAMYKK